MAAKKKPSVKSKAKISTTVAKSPDGTIQLNFTIPWSDVKSESEKVVVELGKNTTVSGFRKGKAPLTRLLSHLPKETIVEKTLQKILPKLFAEAIKEHKITPAMYPRFEIIKATEKEDWQIRAITCELPEINLGDYKKMVSGALAAKAIWTPEKGKPTEKKELTKEEKEEEVMKALLQSVKITIPEILTKEEVENRLATLLERLEKLGLSLDTYLASIKKTPQSLRDEYKSQAEETIKLELILNQIANQEGLSVSEKEIDSFVDAAIKGDPNLKEKFETPEQKRILASILRKRKVLDQLSSAA